MKFVDQINDLEGGTGRIGKEGSFTVLEIDEVNRLKVCRDVHLATIHTCFVMCLKVSCKEKHIFGLILVQNFILSIKPEVDFVQSAGNGIIRQLVVLC